MDEDTPGAAGGDTQELMKMKKTLPCILALCLVLTAAWALADSGSGA
jgi:hypothetical protein